MVDFFASRPMEDFFINPTIMDDSLYSPSLLLTTTTTTPTATTTTTPTMDGTAQYRAALHDYHHERRSSSTKEFALKQFALPTRLTLPRPGTNSWQGYTSEEEQPSPTDHDSSSSRSDEAISVGSDVSFPDHLASSYSSVEQQCSQARVVTIQSAGRAKVVSLPKLITNPAGRTVVRPAEHTSDAKRRPSILRLEPVEEPRSSRNSQDSTSSTGSSRSVGSAASTAPSSVDDESFEKTHPLRHKRALARHVPLMEAARAITPTSPSFPPSATAIRRGSMPVNQASMTPRSPTNPPLRRVSKFGLNRAFTLGKATARREDGLESVKEPEPSPVAPLPTQAQFPPRRSSINRTKLVARGAGDREPPISLPPFPA